MWGEGGESLELTFWGNGSSLTDTSEIVVHDKPFENDLVHDIRFGERKRFTNKASEALT